MRVQKDLHSLEQETKIMKIEFICVKSHSIEIKNFSLFCPNYEI